VKRLVASSGSGGSGSASGSAGSGAGAGGQAGNGTASPDVGTSINGSGRGPLSALLHPILSGSSSGGLGVLLPVFLIAALVLVLGATVLRRRLGSSSDPQT
jgi:hypothetical protein